MGISIIVGNQGAGKSCLGVIKALKYLKEGFPVYSNLPVKGCYKFNKDDIMKNEFKKDAVLLFDEGATYGLGSRGDQYKKNTTSGIVEFFTMHRHYGIKEVIIISPNFTDVIPSVRDNATTVTVVKRGFLSLVGLISKRDVIRNYSIDEMANELKYAYKWKGLSLWWFRPSKAYEYFDSWTRKELQSKNWELWSDLELNKITDKSNKFEKLLTIIRGKKNVRKRIKKDILEIVEDEEISKDIQEIDKMDKEEIIKDLFNNEEE